VTELKEYIIDHASVYYIRAVCHGHLCYSHGAVCLTVTIRQSEMDSRIDECLAQSQVSAVGSLTSYVNTEGLVGLIYCKTLFVHAIY
jgi:hypothetical protein